MGKFCPNAVKFTKPRARTRPGPPPPRLSPREHLAYARLIRANGPLRAWASELRLRLEPPDAIEASDLYAWINNKIRTGGDAPRMTFTDAARIYKVGLRSRSDELASAFDWQTGVNREVPNVVRFNYGLDVPPDGPRRAIKGDYGEEFAPIILQELSIARVASRIAGVAFDRDRKESGATEGKRTRKRAEIERLLREEALGSGGPAHSNGADWIAFRAREIVMRHLFAAGYSGQLESPTLPLSEFIWRISHQVEASLKRLLSDDDPHATDRLLRELDAKVERNRGADAS